MKSLGAYLLLLLLGITATTAQLNYEGSPLTENTEYIAQESNFAQERSDHRLRLFPVYSQQVVANEIDGSWTPSNQGINSNGTATTKLRNVTGASKNVTGAPKNVTGTSGIRNKAPSVSRQSLHQVTSAPETTTQREKVLYQQQQQQVPHSNSGNDPSEAALRTFLSSRTPEESQASLDYFLLSTRQDYNAAPPPPRISEIVLPRQSSGDSGRWVQQLEPEEEQQLQLQHQQQQQRFLEQNRIDQLQLHHHHQQQQQRQLQSQPQPDRQPPSQLQFHPQLQSQRGPQEQWQLQSHKQLQQRFQEGHQYPHQQMQLQDEMDTYPVGTLPAQLQPGQIRNELGPMPAWRSSRRPMRRIRGRPVVAPPQPRLGGFYKGHPPGPGPLGYPHGKTPPPVEVIYTRPPGFGGPAPISNPPVPYEDASAWFPEVDGHSPPPGAGGKNVYYSQLYAQSYDPHYYEYIAKTGKIRPHLYGKLGATKDDGIWSELLRGFKKHGLKNMMTPSFLLGLTIPMLTIMLTALVQKRSLARSDSGASSFHVDEQLLLEYAERLRAALERHGDVGGGEGEGRVV